jgi:hypothetical protein
MIPPFLALSIGGLLFYVSEEDKPKIYGVLGFSISLMAILTVSYGIETLRMQLMKK